VPAFLGVPVAAYPEVLALAFLEAPAGAFPAEGLPLACPALGVAYLVAGRPSGHLVLGLAWALVYLDLLVASLLSC
jgi:hypothetical protein